MLSRALLICCAASFAGNVAVIMADDDISIRIVETGGEATIVVQGVSEAELASLSSELRPAHLSKLLRVYAGEESTNEQPPVLGSVHVSDGQLIFKPRYPLRPGLAYRVAVARELLGSDGANGDLPADFERVVRMEAGEPREATVITAIFPSGEVLPENLLKFYVHFSAPMAQGSVYRHVRLLDEEGREVDYPFVNVGQELWDR
jgi:hypothetical protein